MNIMKVIESKRSKSLIACQICYNKDNPKASEDIMRLQLQFVAEENLKHETIENNCDAW